MFHEEVALCNELHICIFNSVMDHFDVTSAAVIAYVLHTWFPVIRFCGNLFKNVADIVICLSLSPRHQRRAVQCTFLAPAYTHADVVDLFFCELYVSATSVFILFITAVDQRIAFFKKWCDLFDCPVSHFPCLHKHEYISRLLQIVHEGFECFGNVNIFLLQFIQTVFPYIFKKIERDDFESFAGHVFRYICTHYTKTDDSNIINHSGYPISFWTLMISMMSSVIFASSSIGILSAVV